MSNITPLREAEALREFILEGSRSVSALFFEFRHDMDIHALPAEVKLALRDIEGWALKAKAVVGGMDPRTEYDLTPFSRTFAPPLRDVVEGEDPGAARVTTVNGMMIVELP